MLLVIWLRLLWAVILLIGFDEVQVASSLPDHPNVGTDGSLVLDQVTGISASGAGFFSYYPEDCWRGNRCPDGVQRSRRGFSSLYSPFSALRCGVLF